MFLKLIFTANNKDKPKHFAQEGFFPPTLLIDIQIQNRLIKRNLVEFRKFRKVVESTDPEFGLHINILEGDVLVTYFLVGPNFTY